MREGVCSCFSEGNTGSGENVHKTGVGSENQGGGGELSLSMHLLGRTDSLATWECKGEDSGEGDTNVERRKRSR